MLTNYNENNRFTLTYYAVVVKEYTYLKFTLLLKFVISLHKFYRQHLLIIFLLYFCAAYFYYLLYKKYYVKIIHTNKTAKKQWYCILFFFSNKYSYPQHHTTTQTCLKPIQYASTLFRQEAPHKTPGNRQGQVFKNLQCVP